ncbi:unnamed protein product [Brassicogethes aeneus]|uniref:Uncharacterized protein n=1 Tax=Brassicogethes aeneus TaxID=1431903 RepID=A0A9P0B273_BRAAE|nr:unnamed protein product [Brassicogethes aeneus]
MEQQHKQITAVINEINDIKAGLADLKNAINVQKEHFKPDEQFEEVLSELSEREKRKTKAIIWGLPESSNATNNSNNDKQSIIDIFSKVGFQHEPTNMVRLGKPIPNSTYPRPIKLTFSNQEAVFQLLKNNKTLKEKNIKNIYITSDKTPKQQVHYKSLKNKMEERIKNGEAGLRLRYLKGIPTIISQSSDHLN